MRFKNNCGELAFLDSAIDVQMQSTSWPCLVILSRRSGAERADGLWFFVGEAPSGSSQCCGAQTAALGDQAGAARCHTSCSPISC